MCGLMFRLYNLFCSLLHEIPKGISGAGRSVVSSNIGTALVHSVQLLYKFYLFPPVVG